MLVLYDRNGFVGRDYLYDNALVEDAWTHLIVRWDGEELDVWINGVRIEPSSRVIDQSFSMEESTELRTWVGGEKTGIPTQLDVGSIAIWGHALGDGEIIGIYGTGTREYNLLENNQTPCGGVLLN